LLQFDDSAERPDGAAELGKHAITGRFDQTTAVPTERGHYTSSEICLEERVGAAFVPTHQARIANHIYRDNSGESALFVGH